MLFFNIFNMKKNSSKIKEERICLDKIEKRKFNEIDIDNIFPDFESVLEDELIKFLYLLSEEEIFIILKDSRVLKKINISDKLDENQLKRISYLLSKKLSITTIEFINSFDFDVETFLLDPNNYYKRRGDIDPIVSKYGMYDYFDMEAIISVADLLGHDGCINCGDYKGKNILYTFENYFKKGGDNYHTKALGLLEYKSGEQLIKELIKRNDTIDIKVDQVGEGKYFISSNGFHRFTVLRFHYLLDCMKNEKNSEELRELYSIPVTITSKINYKKTYCNYLLKKADLNISNITSDLKKDIITINYNSPEKKLIINEKELLDLTIQFVDMLDSDSLSEIQEFYNCIDSFRDFINRYIPNLLNMIEVKSKKLIKK